MREKTAGRYFILFGLCLVLFWSSACQKMRTHSAKNIQLINGQFTAEINHLKLWYKVAGQGPVCILSTPGWGPSSELYFLKLSQLEDMFTMVYLDSRGSGRSERPELHEYSMSNFAADIEGLRNHLEVEKIWLIGHSDGGPMVLTYTHKYPDRVKGLILVDAPVGDTSKNEERARRMQLRKGEPWFDAAMKQWGQMPQTQEEFDLYIKGILPFFFSSMENLEKNKAVFNQTSLSFHATQGRGQSVDSLGDIMDWLPELVQPVLIIVGNDDFICTPSGAQILHTELPHSELLVIEDAGHFPWLEQPEQFFGGIRIFLTKLGYPVK